MPQPIWKISSYCASGGCVAVAATGDRVLLRDEKDPGGPVLAFDPPVWAAFLDAVKSGALDGAL